MAWSIAVVESHYYECVIYCTGSSYSVGVGGWEGGRGREGEREREREREREIERLSERGDLLYDS